MHMNPPCISTGVLNKCIYLDEVELPVHSSPEQQQVMDWYNILEKASGVDRSIFVVFLLESTL